MQMDKRSVLVDALAYLQDILHQTKIEMENQNNISGTADAAIEDPREYIVGSPTSPIDVETDHLPCHHLGVVSDKSLVNASAEVQPQPIMMSTVHEPSKSPNSALFPAITMMEADKIDEERYLLKIVYNKALGAMAHVQRSVEMLKGIEFIDISISEYDQHHMQSTTFLRVKKIKGSILVTDAENLLQKVKIIAKQLGVRLPLAASSEGQ
ncbi:hypothetical protein MKW92_025392 [Papaver armeniacum]|nr:hypothetical protein MKW92_025392 [Papaver armeniacum]